LEGSPKAGWGKKRKRNIGETSLMAKVVDTKVHGSKKEEGKNPIERYQKRMEVGGKAEEDQVKSMNEVREGN